MITKFKVGDHVDAKHSGNVYVITHIVAHDLEQPYRARRIPGGVVKGPTRRFAEDSLRLSGTLASPDPAYLAQRGL